MSGQRALYKCMGTKRCIYFERVRPNSGLDAGRRPINAGRRLDSGRPNSDQLRFLMGTPPDRVGLKAKLIIEWLEDYGVENFKVGQIDYFVEYYKRQGMVRLC